MTRTILRALRDASVLVALALLPAAGAGCAADRARGSEHHRPVPYQPPTVEPTASPPAGMAESPPGFRRTESAPPAARKAPFIGAAPWGGGTSHLVPPQSMPAPHEELWIIQKHAGREPADDEPTPGSGLMAAPRGQELVPIPLKHTDVKADIVGHVAAVDVTQQFHNPYDGKIEAVYVFPLPHNAAVNEFLMTVGDRRIRGVIREREDARQVYAQAKGQGYVASLLEQDRPNVFTQKVANVEPGKSIDVSVRYFHTLSYSGGWYEWVFPMVPGARFNPPGSVGGAGAARGSRGALGQKTEVQYLRPGKRSGHDVAVAVTLDALVPVEAVESRTHPVTVKRTSAERAAVTLDAGDTVPSRDFVLRWKVAGEGVKSGMVARRAKDGDSYFAMTVVPPADLGRLPRSPVEMVFALDVSASVSGRPIEQAKAAVRWALAHMRPDDIFQIVRFGSRAEAVADRPLAASPENVRRAIRFIEGGDAGGGTGVPDVLRAALSTPRNEGRRRYVVFLTDGYLGNEAEIVGELRRTLGDARVFAIGVGSSPNRYLIEHMAKLGRGAVAYIGPGDDAEEVMAAYFNAATRPALTDLAIDTGGAEAADVYPRRLPDLFVGRPVTIVGRFAGDAPAAVTLRGRVDGDDHAVEVAVARSPGKGAVEAALPAVWARMKIADLVDRLATEPTDSSVAAQVRQVAVEHGLMSAYTAPVAVDSMTRTAGGHGTTGFTPVPVPEGVRYDTTVSE